MENPASAVALLAEGGGGAGSTPLATQQPPPRVRPGSVQRAGTGLTALSGEGQARERYLELCTQSWVRPNSEVLRILGEPEEEEGAKRRSGPITRLEFKRNYLGDAGARPLFAGLRLLTNLSELNVRSTGLRDGAVVFLCTSIATHPSLGTLDVSDNEINDAQGGRALVHLVTENILITKLRCDNTRMTEKTKGVITSTVLNNCRNAPKMLRKNAYETTNSMPHS